MPRHYNKDEHGHISELDAADRLSNNGIKVYDKVISVPVGAQIGLKLWTCIDCLKLHHGYRINRS